MSDASSTTTPTFSNVAPAGANGDPYVPVDEDTPVRPSQPGSMLDDLIAEASREVVREPSTLKIPGRPGWAVRFDVNLDEPIVTAWRKKAADKSKPEGFDMLKFSKAVLANQAEAILRLGSDESVENAKVVLDPSGNPVNFRNAWFLEQLGGDRILSPVEAVKKWYGVDGTIISHCGEVLYDAGFGEDAERLDPTQRS